MGAFDREGRRGRAVRCAGAGVLLGAALWAAASCRPRYWPRSVGDRCISAQEYDASFPGFDEDEVSLELDNAACGPDAVCLVNQFRGRVSCPYGQTWDGLEQPPTDEARCALPAGAAEPAAAVPVRPQLEARLAEDTVHCSCRCANAAGRTDDGARYCDCPPGLTCAPLFDDLERGNAALAGSYCVKRGTAFDASAPPGPTCNRSTRDCGAASPELDVPEPDARSLTVTQFIEQIVQGTDPALDLLFVIDNSPGMRQNQELFASAAARLVHEFVTPSCQTSAGDYVPREGGDCPDGTSGYEPLLDIHIGAISTSLGGHGGTLCSPASESYVAQQDDRGELFAPLRGVPTPELPTGEPAGFLAWDQLEPGGFGTRDASELEQGVEALVLAAGDEGCGFEAGLEAWYRFLIDPAPPVEVTKQGAQSAVGAVNATLLEQRSWFLRPDSLLAIVMLSDENDCSIRDDGAAWLLGDLAHRLPRGTDACATDPNGPCCRSCALDEDTPPPGCAPLDTDPACALGGYGSTEEVPQLRCFEQKRRFGIDFLHPWQRYVDGLRLPRVLGAQCATDADCPAHHRFQTAGSCRDLGSVSRCEYRNPIHSANPNYPYDIPRADSSLVFLAGVVGVPWQDVAKPASLDDPEVLRFLRTTEDPRDPGAPTLADRWEVIVGNPEEDLAPTDPFMIESIDPREGLGTNPVTGDAPQPVTALADGSPINGHEYTIPRRDDLQYACSFPLAEPRDCASAAGACDCRPGDPNALDRPLCQAPGTADAGTVQYSAKAYPATRYLKVLQEYGTNAIVTSACPKQLDPARPDDDGFGYLPATLHIARTLLGRLRPAGPDCLPRSLPLDAEGGLDCQLVEVTEPWAGVSCLGPGRRLVTGPLEEAARRELRKSGRCGEHPGQTPCAELTVCGIEPARGTALASCLADEHPRGEPGYCYVDTSLDLNGDHIVECEAAGDPDCLGDPSLVADCDPSRRRLLRFVSPPDDPLPRPGATIMLGCDDQRGVGR